MLRAPTATFHRFRRPAIAACIPVLAFIMFASASRASNPTFTPVCYYDNVAAAMAIADFNGDGRADLAIGAGHVIPGQSFATQIVSVYPGNGDGTFGAPTQLDAGSLYLYLCAGDVNGDGKTDLVAASQPLAVFLGNGNNTFQAPRFYNGGSSTGIALGDLNGDGSLDIAVTNANGKSVGILFNKGNGTFKDKVLFPTSFQTWAITIADLNNDGIADMAALNHGFAAESNGLSVFLGEGGGKFRPSTYRTLPFFAGREIIAKDLNGDGKLDIVGAAQADGGILTLRGHGDGTFDAPVQYPMTGNTIRAAIGDINGDGNTDIVAGNFRAFFPNPGGTVTILYGDGAGNFTSGGPITVGFGMAVAALDINSDGRTDVISDGCVLLNGGAAAPTARLAPVPVTQGSEAAFGISPNPLRARGLLRFSVPRSGPLSIKLFDVGGRLVRTLDDRWAEAGPQEVAVARGSLPTGIYLYRIDANGYSRSGRMVVME